MKSATKVTVQIEDYKGVVSDVTGFKSVKRNNSGNLKGFVGSTMVVMFGYDTIQAAMWFLDTEDSSVAAEFLKTNLI